MRSRIREIEATLNRIQTSVPPPITQTNNLSSNSLDELKNTLDDTTTVSECDSNAMQVD